jgi:RimJ/RimL family protein N-acetyltransferase
VFALIRPENTPSQAVALKLGMKPDKLTIQHSSFEHLVFSVSRTD